VGFEPVHPPRVVLDTNICLDLLLFRDAGSRALADALAAGRWHAVSRADCRDEWLHVLRYPQFRVDEAQYGRLVQAFDALMRPWQPVDEVLPELPVCRDPDDQKFLELAWQARASALVSKDKALLKLARRARKRGLFAIVSPQGWCEAWC
jgi:uncharacterized protein